jgi:parallel beta-helix repeat protein
MMNPYLNIMDFGAAGDGESDDTPALKNALEEARTGNGTIYFPTGHYRIHPLRLPGHVTLMGDSAWAYGNRGGADPDYAGRTVLSALSDNGRALLDVGSERGVRILGLTLEGNKIGEGLHGVYIRHDECEQGTCIEDCYIANFTGSGVRLEKTWVFGIRRCLIKNNREHGIDCTSGYDGWIIDNQLTANGGAGLYARGAPAEDLSPEEVEKLRFFGAASVMVTANRIEWNRTGGILLGSSNSMQITGCALDHNFGPGIHLWDSICNTISGCMVRSNGAERQGDDCCQIRLENCQGISATGNSLWGWYDRKEGKFDYPYPYYGFVLRNLDGCVISQNALYHSSSEEAVRDHGGHEETFVGQNTFVKPQIQTNQAGWNLLKNPKKM